MSDNLVNLADAANSAIVDPVPQIAPPQPNTVNLIRGVFNASTQDWESVATVRELTGEDEEFLAALDAKEELSYSEYLVHLLQRAVVTIGSQSVQTAPGIIDDLIIGDRDLLFLGILRMTYGNIKQVQMTCGNCSQDNDIDIDLTEDFKVHQVDTDCTKPIVVELRDGSSVSFTMPTTGDSKYAFQKAKTTAEQSTYIIARCLISDMERDAREIWSKKLGLADRRSIIKAITAVQPGPRMEEVKTQCAHCEQEMVIVLDWVSLLFG